MKPIVFYILTIPFLTACGTQQAEIKPSSGAFKTPTDSIPFNAKYSSSLPKDEVTKNYCQAIAEYIKASHKEDKALPETLFIGKHDEFPAITLPATIQKINIKLVTTDDAEKYMQQQKPTVFLNIIGWLQKNKSEFIIVTFFEEGKPQHNCHVYFTHHSGRNEFELDSLSFEYPYANTVPTKN